MPTYENDPSRTPVMSNYNKNERTLLLKPTTAVITNRDSKKVTKSVKSRGIATWQQCNVSRSCISYTLGFIAACIFFVLIFKKIQYDKVHVTSNAEIDSILRAKNSLDILNEGYIKQLTKHIKKKQEVAEVGCQSTVLIMRHCEEDDIEDEKADAAYAKTTNHEMSSYDVLNNMNNSTSNSTIDFRHCSAKGYLRSQYLTTLFGYDSKWQQPSILYALSTDRTDHLNYREYETLKPLADKYQLEIELLTNHILRKEYFKLLNRGELCDKLSIICWKHSLIPTLANSLGCSPANGCPMSYNVREYDEVWQLKYSLRDDGHQHENKTKNVENISTTVTATNTDLGSEGKDITFRWHVSGSIVFEHFNSVAFRESQEKSQPTKNASKP